MKTRAAFSMSSPSKHTSLTRLLQIKQDNYMGEGGKDYCPFEVEELILDKKNRLATSQLNAVNRWEKTLDKYLGMGMRAISPPVPKVTEKPAFAFVIQF